MSVLPAILKHGLFKPTTTAVIDDMGSYSYAKLVGGAFYLAKLIDSVTDRSHIGIMLPTSSAFPMALLGAWLSKRTAVSINYLLAEDDLQHIINDSGIDCLITVGKMLEVVPEGGIPENIRIIKLEEERKKFGKIPPLRIPPKLADDDVALLLYTSGTSGKPKGVMLTHKNLESNARGAIEHCQLNGNNTFLGVLPQFHSFGVLALTLVPLVAGAKVVYTARFLPKKLVALIKEHRPEVFMAVPSMYGALLSVKSATSDDFTSLKYAVSGGEPLSDAIYEEYKTRLGVELLEGYGLTETSPAANWSTPERHRRYAVGPTLPGVMNIIVDNDDKPLPANEEGEILIAGPNIMKGYHNLPEKTAEVMTEVTPLGASAPIRAFRSGDIGKVDDEGFLYITGRKKEMLIISGENVFPREIEEVLNQHPAVGASAVVGKQDGMRGEVPIAFVELNGESEASDADLRNHCREALPQFKVPREIRIIEELPRNPTGKILRRKLEV